MASDKDLWAAAMGEVEDPQSRDAGLWAKCYAEADGNEPKAKAAYIRHRVDQLTPAAPTGYCPNCGYELPLKADACPNCKAVFDHQSSWAPTKERLGNEPARGKQSREPSGDTVKASAPAETSNGSAWPWIIGLPVALFAAFLVFGALQPSDPEKTKARRVYEMCLSDLASADRARSSTGGFIASTCEMLRKEFIQKYGVAP